MEKNKAFSNRVPIGDYNYQQCGFCHISFCHCQGLSYFIHLGITDPVGYIEKVLSAIRSIGKNKCFIVRATFRYDTKFPLIGFLSSEEFSFVF